MKGINFYQTRRRIKRKLMILTRNLKSKRKKLKQKNS